MARPLRLIYEGAVYHITARGNERRDLFMTDADRERYLFSLAESLQRYDVRCYLFCLMRNHVHLVIHTPRGNLSQFMQRLQTAYTVWFNRKHQRSGHLFQGRYGAALVEEDDYILKLSRYVHLNPIFIAEQADKSRKERVAVLRSYAWSSYRSYMGLTKPLDFMTYEPVLGMMDLRPKRQKAVYRRFVEAGIVDIDTTFIEAKRRSVFCIGSDDRHAQVSQQHKQLVQGYEHREDLQFQQVACRYDPDEIIQVVAQALDVKREDFLVRRRDSWLRALCSRALQVYGGLTQREIATALSIGSGVAVSKQLRLLDEALKHDKQVQLWWNQIRKLFRIF